MIHKEWAVLSAVALAAVAASSGGHTTNEVGILDGQRLFDSRYLTLTNSTLLGVDTTGDKPKFEVRLHGRFSNVGQRTTIPADWSIYDLVTMRVTNIENRTVRCGFAIQCSPDPNDYQRAFTTSFSLGPGETKRLVFVFTMPNPRAFSLTTLPPIFAEPYEAINVGASVWTQRVYHWRVSLHDSSSTRIRVGDLMLAKYDSRFIGLADRYHQYAVRDWPGKIRSDLDFQTARLTESNDLAQHPGPNELDGSRSLPAQSPTGRWSLARRGNGNRYFVHPSGRLFWSLGIQGIHDWQGTPIDGRAQMFEQLPSQSGRYADLFVPYRTPLGVDVTQFLAHRYNLRLKYGDDYLDSFVDVTKRRLASWGANTVGAWSHPRFNDGTMPYTLALSTDNFPTRLDTPVMAWGPLPDPYSSNFRSWMGDRFRTELTSSRGLSNLMGVFVDNELSWGRTDTIVGSLSIGLGALNAPSSQPAKVALIRALKTSYRRIGNLNKAWGTSFRSWLDLDARTDLSGRVDQARVRRDLLAFAGSYAATYFSKVKSALGDAGYDGLYLGCRFYHSTPEVVRAAGRYVDVLSFNLYGRASDIDWNGLNALPKPVLISEFSFTAQERGSIGGNVELPTFAARAQALREYTQAALRSPNIVGIHWFEYADEPVTGTSSAGLNSQLGLTSITDTPHAEMVAVLRQLSQGMYGYRN